LTDKLANRSTIEIALAHGEVLRCTPFEAGSALVPKQWRWRLTDSLGREYVGPLYAARMSEPDVKTLIVGWWEAKTELERSAATPAAFQQNAPPGRRDSNN
jgi:hypothetical protein